MLSLGPPTPAPTVGAMGRQGRKRPNTRDLYYHRGGDPRRTDTPVENTDKQRKRLENNAGKAADPRPQDGRAVPPHGAIPSKSLPPVGGDRQDD